jgi:nitrogen-specific signal transduction histidine kinase
MTEELMLETEFAPAERNSLSELERQSSAFMAALPHYLLDALPVAISILNRRRQIIYANRPLVQATDSADRRALLGLRPGESLCCIHAFEHKGGCGTTKFCRECGAVKAIQSSLLGKQAVEECCILRRHNDRIESLDLRVWTTPIEHDMETFVILALADIGHEKRRQALEHIFFHDILNTAGTLRLAAELIPGANADSLRDLIEIIPTASARLIQEIETQRGLLAAENDELTVHPARLRSAAFLQQMVQTYASHPAAQGRGLRVAPDAPDIEFVSDSTLLGRVLGNMIKNALEASEPGQTVTVGCQVTGTNIQFWVHNPTLMDEKVQYQIFHRSFSTKGRGRGLGTYSMQLLSERYLQGQVSFTSSPESGTIFVGKYPLRLGLPEQIEVAVQDCCLHQQQSQ